MELRLFWEFPLSIKQFLYANLVVALRELFMPGRAADWLVVKWMRCAVRVLVIVSIAKG